MRPLLVLVLWIVAVNAGGYEDFLCGKDSKRVISPCNLDCQINHAKTGGHCGNVNEGDFNCYCNSEITTKEFEASEMKLSRALNCRDRNDDSRNVCTLDCLCNHAAFGGYCDFDLKACHCMGVGLNKQNLYCPARNLKEFIDISYNYLGRQGLGDNGMLYIENVLNKIKDRKDGRNEI